MHCIPLLPLQGRSVKRKTLGNNAASRRGWMQRRSNALNPLTSPPRAELPGGEDAHHAASRRGWMQRRSNALNPLTSPPRTELPGGEAAHHAASRRGWMHRRSNALKPLFLPSKSGATRGRHLAIMQPAITAECNVGPACNHFENCTHGCQTKIEYN